jgi:hypothetical protein
MVLSCLIWYLWKEQNNRKFEDLKRTLEEFKFFFFHSLFSWIATYLALLVLAIMISLYFFLPLLKWSFCILLMYQGYAFNIISLTYQKKKNNLQSFLCFALQIHHIKYKRANTYTFPIVPSNSPPTFSPFNA